VHQALSDLFALLDAIRDMRPDHAMETIFQEADYLGYLEGMAKTKEEYESRQDNLKELVYLASMKESMEDYLEETTLVQEDREEEDERNRYGVKLSTAHASKGLEFLTVFVVGCEEMTFPHWRCMDTAAELEEERRLMYVAVTRAEKNLYLTSASSRRKRPTMQSRFLDEIEEYLDEEFAA
jgi:DNA helicase-2/ATP-dependent DNA helicase PcrA